VLANLIGNAIKFTECGGVEVTAHSARERHRLSVADTGPGIPRKEHARVFQAFVRLDGAHHEQTPGVGLGLAIVRDLVTALGGELALESEPGRGTKFTIDLPPLS
jgi:signal transduction histidine kinase